jgi:hypothetical protein
MRYLLTAWLAAGLTGLAGCGGGVAKVPVEGKVVWADGTPAKELAGGVVQFEPPDKGVGARGVIGPDGSFKLGTDKEADGVVPGEYRVLVAENRPTVKETESEAELAPPKMDPKFGDWQTSGLTATITSGTNSLTLKVAKAGKRR